MPIYNFSAGPAMLPKEVMQRAQAEFCDFAGSGSGILELSHRGKFFEPVIQRAEANVRELMNISNDYAVCFIQGGASMQFAMLAMNLLNGGTADYIDTGVWANKAAKEAKLFGKVNIAASSKETKYDHIPAASEWKLTPGAAYMPKIGWASGSVTTSTTAGRSWARAVLMAARTSPGFSTRSPKQPISSARRAKLVGRKQ